MEYNSYRRCGINTMACALPSLRAYINPALARTAATVGSAWGRMINAHTCMFSNTDPIVQQLHKINADVAAQMSMCESSGAVEALLDKWQ